MNNSDISDLIRMNDKDITEEVNDYIKSSNRLIKEKGVICFPVEFLPKSFNNIDKKTIEFNREILKRKGLEKDCDNLVKLELEAYLKSINVKKESINNFIISIIEKLIIKKKGQIKEINLKIKDIDTDPNNSGNPYIGVRIIRV